MSIKKHPDAERAARQVLSGEDAIKAEMADVDPVEYAVAEYGEDALIDEIDDAAADLEASTPADKRALKCMDGNDRVAAADRRMKPARYLREQYGVNAAEHTTVDALREAVVAAATEGEN